MSANDVPQMPVSEDDAHAREAAAKSLRRQIEKLAGREPRSLNEFAEQQKAENSPREQGNK